MVLLAQAWSLIYQFWIHTERIARLPRPVEGVLQHAVAPPRPPRLQRAVPGQELRRHPDHLGPHVRDLRARGRARALRPDDADRDLQPGPRRVPRVHRARARRPRRARPSHEGPVRCAGRVGGPERNAFAGLSQLCDKGVANFTAPSPDRRRAAMSRPEMKISTRSADPAAGARGRARDPRRRVGTRMYVTAPDEAPCWGRDRRAAWRQDRGHGL